MTSPSASTPNLKKRGAMFYVILGGALVLLAGAIVAVVVTLKTPKDPGPAACDHIEQQAEMGPLPWDAFVEILAGVVEERVKTSQGEVVRIHSQRRDDKCKECLRKLEKNLAANVYEAVARCIADATLAKQAVRCLDVIPKS